jgi:transmembrane sensor
MTKELLIKFLNDQCNSDELQEVIRWIKNDSFSNESRNWGLDDWMNFKEGDGLVEDEKLRSLLDKIHHKINLEGYKKPRKKSIALITTWITRVAALLLLPALIFLIYTLSESPPEVALNIEMTIDSLEIIAPIGSKTVVQFSDGTEVFLNHGSKIKYPQKFTGNAREVFLTGEGYFDVAHNPDMPFIVRTKNLNIEALGTEFNVSAYPDENIVATTLVNGKVVLKKELANQENITLGAMVPEQHVSYNIQTGKISSSKGEIEKYICWKNGKLIFKRDSIITIAKRLSRWYNVDIEVSDTDVREYTYTATFVDESLDHILELLKKAAPINYIKIPSKQLPDGSFSRQKIIITTNKNL